MDDYISRQAAIDALQKEINKGIPPFDDVIGSIRCGVRLARNIIEDLPSADAVSAGAYKQTAWERDTAIAQLEELGYSLGEKIRHGRWILQTDKSKKLYGWHICSECGAYIGEPTNYCSNCGAHMDEGERNE